MHIAVIGAGIFGTWTALHLLRRNHRVSLIDTWGPGNSRSSSGGETRVLRGSYGPQGIYTEMVARSLPMWRENEQKFNTRLFRHTGALWIASEDDSWEWASVEELKKVGLPVEVLQKPDLEQRYPQINWEGLDWAILEKEAGYLVSRRACRTLWEGFMAEGGEYKELQAKPGEITDEEMDPLRLSDGTTLRADIYVWACGPWLGRLFPVEIGGLITPTRQEVFFFGIPAGLAGYSEEQMPTWVENSTRRYYGVPGNDRRGFKVAEDTPREPFDPSHGDRLPSANGLIEVRQYLSYRFPALRKAPLLEARVCQYEMSPDGGFLMDRHPACQNAFFLGGGSGHGFKLAPALAEQMADIVEGYRNIPGIFALDRFTSEDRNKVSRMRF